MCKLYGSMNLNCPVYSVQLWCKLYPMTVEFYKKQSIAFVGRNALKRALRTRQEINWSSVYRLSFNH
jgi:hypothetical protein